MSIQQDDAPNQPRASLFESDSRDGAFGLLAVDFHSIGDR